MAVVSLMLFVESLQVTIRAAMKQDEDSHNLLLPLTETVSSYSFTHFCSLASFVICSTNICLSV